VGARPEREPLVAGQHRDPAAAVDRRLGAGAPEDEGSGIARAVQHVQYGAVPQRPPDHFPAVGPGPHPPGEADALRGERADHGAGRAGPPEGGEVQLQRLPDMPVGVADDPPVVAVGQADRQRQLEGPPAGLVEDAPT